MATIAQALSAGVLEEHRMPGHDGRPPLRPLYLASAFIVWVNATPELDDVDWSKNSGGRSRFEHLEQTLADFRCDRRPLVGDLNRIQPDHKGVWKMHSPGLRLFGWVPDEWSIVLVTGAFVADTHGPRSVVKDKMKEVLAFMQRNKLQGAVRLGDRSELFQQKNR